MRIFALETDSKKIIKRYCSPDECVLYVTHFHGMLFAIQVLKNMIITLPIIGLIIGVIVLGSPLGITLAIGGPIVLISMLPIVTA
jgi:hypothetical protein